MSYSKGSKLVSVESGTNQPRPDVRSPYNYVYTCYCKAIGLEVWEHAPMKSLKIACFEDDFCGIYIAT